MGLSRHEETLLSLAKQEHNRLKAENKRLREALEVAPWPYDKDYPKECVDVNLDAYYLKWYEGPRAEALRKVKSL